MMAPMVACMCGGVGSHGIWSRWGWLVVRVRVVARVPGMVAVAWGMLEPALCGCAAAPLLSVPKPQHKACARCGCAGKPKKAARAAV